MKAAILLERPPTVDHGGRRWIVHGRELASMSAGEPGRPVGRTRGGRNDILAADIQTRGS